MKLGGLRRRSGASGVMEALFRGAADRDVLEARTGMSRAVLRGHVRRLRLRGLVAGDPMSLTSAGRWQCIAMQLGLSMAELAAVSCLHAQMEAWDATPALRDSGAGRFAIRDASPFLCAGYRTGGARDVYNRLVMKGWIFRVSNGGIVAMDPRHLNMLRPYREDLARLQEWTRGGPRH